MKSYVMYCTVHASTSTDLSTLADTLSDSSISMYGGNCVYKVHQRIDHM